MYQGRPVSHLGRLEMKRLMVIAVAAARELSRDGGSGFLRRPVSDSAGQAPRSSVAKRVSGFRLTVRKAGIEERGLS